MSPRKWARAVVLILGTFAVCYLLGKPLFDAYLIAHPFRHVAELRPQDAGAPVERVTFEATDGVPLVGWFVRGSGDKGTIVVSHGSGANGAGAYPQVAFLNRAGYHLFLFDHRAHGQSGGQFTTIGPLEVRDMQGAVRYLRSRRDVDERRIGAIGCSMGSGVSIGAAAEDPWIRGVVIEGIYADMSDLWTRFGHFGIRGTPVHWSWGPLLRWATFQWTGQWVTAFKPEALIGRISPRPVLIIQGELDNAACTVADARRLYQAAGEPKDLWIVPGAGHCGAHSAAPQAYEERVIRFFSRALSR